jgi:ComF family protein
LLEILRHRKPRGIPEEVPRKTSLLKHFRRLAGAAADLLFPPRCLLCSSGEPPFVEPTCCARCFGTVFEPASVPFPVPGLAAGSYTGALRILVTRVKFRADPLPVGVLVRLLEAALPSIGDADAVTSVPPDRARLRRRGVDLPGLLARKLARRSGLPYRPWLVRLRPTASQRGLTREARRTNLAGAFGVAGEVSGRRILVVDDVVTTGATAEAAVSALLAAGAGDVRFLAVAATPLEGGEAPPEA